MVRAAISKGCSSFGFSGHSYAPFDIKGCMDPETTLRYAKEIGELKEIYSGQIELFTGIEREYHGDAVDINVDYTIGSVHYIKKGDAYISIDSSAEEFTSGCETFFNGDYYAMAEYYYDAASHVATETQADFIGHFDIFSKFNFGGSLFDESHPRYVGAALAAMDEIMKACNLFEVNTAPIFKYGKPEPYPSVRLLKALRERGGEVLITSDSHNAESICYMFDEMREMLKSCGFKYMKRLTPGGFVDVAL
ncbi:MAG: histidinol-phosphatase HisJ family protein [Oscillospiraceae bacterium]|nr:histidinol-phosphatase HisJ family protein [Oscillospiraceae bacterium]MCL2126006.1 histidinol-phosphatase HisJ family protein [Oscillospiraceae bacterium]